MSPAFRLKPKPSLSRGDFVMMFTTPVIALAPQTTDAGPRTISTCWTWFEFGLGTRSQSTRPKKSR